MEHAHNHRIDRLRLLCCFGVVLLHSTYGSDIGQVLLNTIFRFSVPVFVIISGYFLLSSSFSRPWNKIFRLFLKMLLCSGGYMMYSFWKSGAFPAQPIVRLLTEPIHLWYLYATMGLYLLTPALLPFVRSADEKEYRYALALCFAMGSCVVTLVRLNWIPLLAVILDKSKMPDMLGFTGLYLLGGYFRKFGIGPRRRWLMIWALSTAIGIGVSGSPYAEHLLGFLSPIVTISSCACFAVFMSLPEPSERIQRPLRSAAACTMGVYLFHMLVSDLITPIIWPAYQMIGGAAFMLLRAMCVFSGTMLTVWLLRKIPILKKWML